jgi:hypothetical protein
LYFSELKNKILAFKVLQSQVMRSQFYFLLTITCIALIAFVTPSHAQEARIPDLEVSDFDHDNFERDKIIYSPGEADTRYIPRASTPNTPKDSGIVRTPIIQPSVIAPRLKTEIPQKTAEHSAPATKAPHEKQAPNKGGDDSILSFNFLYYIIEKYKLQDIVD